MTPEVFATIVYHDAVCPSGVWCSDDVSTYPLPPGPYVESVRSLLASRDKRISDLERELTDLCRTNPYRTEIDELRREIENDRA